MQELDEIIRSEGIEPETYHPVKERSGGAWFPGNEAASLVIQVRHIWDDISELKALHVSTKSNYTKTLILKYVVIELRSLIEVFDRLQGLVFDTPVFDPYEKQGWREITQEEQDKAKKLFKQYSKAKSVASKSIIDVRNQIGAHRGNLDWQQVMFFWDSISPELVNPLIKTIGLTFDYIKSLDLFEWNRVNEDGSIEIVSAHLRPEYFE